MTQLHPDNHPPVELTEEEDKLLKISRYAAEESPDRSRKTGAVIYDDSGKIISVGYNTLPDGLPHLDLYLTRPAKYDFTEHAERNAIYAVAAMDDASTKGKNIIMPWFPCCDCARAIAQSKIKKIISPYPDTSDERWGVGFKASLEIFRKAGVEFVHFIDYLPPPKAIPEDEYVPQPKREGPELDDVISYWNENRELLFVDNSPSLSSTKKSKMKR